MVLYKISIALLHTAIRLSAFFSAKSKLRLLGQQKATAEIQNPNPKWQEKEFVVWVHSASLGEFEQARPLIESIKNSHPKHRILLTFFSPSGYEIRKNYPLADHVTYLPLDTKTNAQAFVRYYKPSIALVIKYEFWYYFMQSCKSQNIPIFSVSSIFRANQRFFTRNLQSNKVLNFVTHFFVQNAESESLLAMIQLQNSTITGDTRFDRVLAFRSQEHNLEQIKAFCGNKKVLVIGSAWSQDLAVLNKFINSNQHYKILIAPHEIDQESIAKITKCIKGDYMLYTNFDLENDCNILIINHIGMLSSLYSLATVAYVGGAFGNGLHNILEPATYGLPIVFGPKYHKFQEAKDLIQQGAAFSIKNKLELNQILKKLECEEFRQKAAKKAYLYVSQNSGANASIMSHLSPYLQYES